MKNSPRPDAAACASVSLRSGANCSLGDEDEEGGGGDDPAVEDGEDDGDADEGDGGATDGSDLKTRARVRISDQLPWRSRIWSFRLSSVNPGDIKCFFNEFFYHVNCEAIPEAGLKFLIFRIRNLLRKKHYQKKN